MKKHFNFKSIYRTALVALCLMTVGVGNAWGGNRRIYFDYSAWTDWASAGAVLKVHCWGGSVDGADYEMSAVEGESNLIYADINDGHTSLCFYRKDPNSDTWWNVTQDWGTIGTYNRFKIRNFKGVSGTDEGKYCWAESGAAIRWTPGVAIDGLVDVHNPHNQAFSFTDNDGTYSVSLSAHTTYQFKILDGSTAYGLDNNVWTSSISNYTLNTSGYALRLCTAGSGTYTFSYNKSTHKISVTYPTVSHPNIDYCYLIDYTSTTWSDGVYIHFKDPSTSNSIAGTTWCGTQVTNKVEIGTGNYYFYYSPGDYPYFNLNEKGDGTDQTGDKSANWGRFLSWNECTVSAWDWCTFTVRIQLENNGANVGEKGTEYVDVAFNSDALDDDIEVPVKYGYTFGGYYTEDGGAGTQLISADGEWTTSAVEDYLDASHHWIHAGMSTTLYAKWTEDKHTVSVAVSPAGAGSVQVNSSNVSSVTGVGIATKSDEMTPIALAGWKFKEWQVTSNLQMDLVNYHSDYQQGTDNQMKINATADNQTITAVFEPRYYLVGKIWDDSADGGMPGWDNYNKPFKVVTTSPVLDTCKLTLSTNTSFYIEVRDKVDGYSYGKSGGTLNDNTTLTFTDKDNKVFVYSNGGTEYTFKITGIDGNGRPQVSVERPYQVNIGRKRVDIDGTDHDDNTGGTVAMSLTVGGDAVANGAWVPYGTSVKYDASKQTGYTVDWYNASDYETWFSNEDYWFHTATSTGNGYAKFTEKATSVTLANDGNGKVQIGGEDATSTTCGVTTTRSLTAVPNAGYKFKNWTTSSSPDFEVDDDDASEVTLTGHGAGTAGTLTANFVERYSIKGTMNGEAWGATHTLSNIGTNAGSKDTCYVTMTLPANTTYEFAIYDEQTGGWYKASTVAVYNMTYTNHTNWEFGDTKTYNCGITTAGKGTYKFIFNITDKTVTVVYPTSYQVNYGASVGGSVTSVVDDDSHAVPNGGYVRSGGSVIYTAAAASGYTFVGWCNNDSYGNTFTDLNPWANSGVAATSSAYAKFKSTNFVIYRTGDMSSDPRAAYDDVESFAGGEISEEIEFRMQVSHLDQWYSLCIPFEVNAVKVWDEEDDAYYDLVPYYRSYGTFYTGHYVIRTPELINNDSIATANFSNWNDPSSPTDYRPSKNTPYIVQWHNAYFEGRYVSFFGAAGQSIPTAMTVKAAPKTKNYVSVRGNDAMVDGTVVDAYTLNGDEIWERPVDKGKSVTIQPFECYIRANSEVTNKYLVIRRGMNFDEIPTDFGTIDVSTPVTAKVLIDGQIYILREGKMYTLQGILVQ